MSTEDLIYTITGCILTVALIIAFIVYIFVIGRESVKLEKELKKEQIKYFKVKNKQLENIEVEDLTK